MEFKRKFPRVGCSIPCEVKYNENEILSGFVTDASADGFGFSPTDGVIPEDFNRLPKIEFKIDMRDFSDIGSDICFEASPKWSRGMIVGFEIELIDKVNFKKWWYLIYKLFFPKNN